MDGPYDSGYSAMRMHAVALLYAEEKVLLLWSVLTAWLMHGLQAVISFYLSFSHISWSFICHCLLVFKKSRRIPLMNLLSWLL